METMSDPEFLAEAAKGKLNHAVPHRIQKLVEEVYKTPKEVSCKIILEESSFPQTHAPPAKLAGLLFAHDKCRRPHLFLIIPGPEVGTYCRKAG